MKEAYQALNEGLDDKAFKLYKKLADDGCAESQYYVGWMYEVGMGTNPSTTNALVYYEQSAQGSSARGQFYLAKLLLRKKKKLYIGFENQQNIIFLPHYID